MSKIHELELSEASVISALYKKGIVDNVFEEKLRENDIYILSSGSQSVIARVKNQKLQLVRENNLLKAIKGENKEQQMLIDYLLDDDIKCVVVTGSAGSGKSFLSCAYAFGAVKDGNYNQLIISRVPASPSKKFDLGFIPGSEEEKLKPWMQVFYSTIDKIKTLSSDRTKIPIINQSLEYIKGVTWDNSLIIIDEAEDLTKQELKMILTRVGANSKILILGDTEQSTEKGCKSTLVDVVKAFDTEDITDKEAGMVATINLEKSLRSEFVNFVLKVM